MLLLLGQPPMGHLAVYILPGLLLWSLLLLSGRGQQLQSPALQAESLVLDERVLNIEQPTSGFLSKRDTHALRIQLPQNETQYPNILLTLTSSNEEGDADVVCYPTSHGNAEDAEDTHWASDHTQGKDYVFMSRETDLYEDAKINLTLNDEDFIGVDISCALYGESDQGTDYLLEIDVDYASRSLIDTEQSAMANIFEMCCRNGPALCLNWKNYTSDNEVSMDFCHFPGSICNADGRLIRLDLRDEKLMCDFPTSDISKLSKLEKLEMDKNNLKGNISDILAAFSDNLVSLSFINLARNALTGKLDAESLCKMSHGNGMLIYLNLRDNSITGSLPDCLFDDTSNLREVDLDRNNLEGTLPKISPNAVLRDLSVAGTGLSGTLDNSLASLEGLTSLDLSDNKFEGTLPDGLGSSPNLARVSLEGNYLIGVIPGSLATSKAMSFLELGDNNLEGFAEEWYSGSMKNSDYIIIHLEHNSLEGEFPRAVAEAPSLFSLHIEENILTGKLPDKVGMFTNLMDLDVQGNHLEGEIPKELAGMMLFNSEKVGIMMKSFPQTGPISLQLDLSHNSLSGTVPPFLHSDRVPAEVRNDIKLGAAGYIGITLCTRTSNGAGCGSSQGNYFNVTCPITEALEYLQGLACIEVEETTATQAEDEDQSTDQQQKTISTHTSSSRKSGLWAAAVGGVLAAIGAFAVLVAMLGRRRTRKRMQINNLVGGVELGQP